jgi:hypothetical protein
VQKEMTDEPLIIRQLREPITDTTRKVRRELLISSAVGIVVVYAGLVPTKIDALGITLSPSNQASFRYVIAAVVLYFMVTFIIYVSSEIIAWGTLYKELELDNFLESASKNLEAAQERVEAASAGLKKADSTEPIDQETLWQQLSEARVLQEALGDLESLRDRRLWLARLLASRDVLLLTQPMRTLRICHEALIPVIIAAFAVWSLFWVS